MTKEQLRIARNTWEALQHAKLKYANLSKLINGGCYLIKLSRQMTDYETYIESDEMFFLTELLEYRRKEVIALEKEFANL